MEIDGIKIDGDSIVRAIEYTYPSGIIFPSAVKKNNVYLFTFLFGIRVSTCDTKMPDDIIGGVRLRKGFLGRNEWEIILSDATTDPSPYWLEKPMADAKSLGGTAWVKEGQYEYQLSSYRDYPAFRPVYPIPVYRWSPTKSQINIAKSSGKSLSADFEMAKNNGQAKLSTSLDTLIHRTWRTSNLVNESAGCQVFANNGALITLAQWANIHIKSKYDPNFVYTLLSKDDFLAANKNQFSFPTYSLYNF